MPHLTEEELVSIERSLAMADTITAETARRLVTEIRRLWDLDRGEPSGHHFASPGSGT